MPFPSASEIKAKVKAKIEPQLHWKVPFEAGVYENSPKWSNKGNVPPTYHYAAAKLYLTLLRSGSDSDSDENMETYRLLGILVL